MFDYTPFDLVSLDEIVAKKEVRDPRKTPKWLFHYVDIASVSNKTFQIKNGKQLLGADAPSRARKVIRNGDVIISTTRPYLKSIALVPAKLDGQICSTGFCVLRPTEKVLSDWLFYCAISDDLIRQITPKMRGANYPAVTDKDVLSAKIPLPPIAEQRRIAACIRECLDRVEEIEGLRTEAIGEASGVYPSRCHDFFSTNVKNDDWRPMQIGELSTMIQYGYTQSATKSPVGPRFLRITDIQNHAVNWKCVPYCKADAKQTQKYKLSKDDILFARTGATTGKSFLITDEPPLSVFASYLIRLRIKHDWVLPGLIYHFFQSPAYWDQIRQNMRGGAQPNINSKVLATLKITVPDSLDEQQNVVDKLDEAFNLSMNLNNSLKNQSEALTFMRESILRKAFAGEL